MAFSRKFLIENGVPEDKVDIVMAERNRTLNDYVPKSDVQAQIDAALAEAQKAAPVVNVTEAEEYKALLAENAKIKAFQTDDFNTVKKPYLDIVWGKLDHGEKHKPYAEQLTAIAETMPDLFNATEPEPKPAAPQFGAPAVGAMPTGNTKPTFESLWGLGKK